MNKSALAALAAAYLSGGFVTSCSTRELRWGLVAGNCVEEIRLIPGLTAQNRRRILDRLTEFTKTKEGNYALRRLVLHVIPGPDPHAAGEYAQALTFRGRSSIILQLRNQRPERLGERLTLGAGPSNCELVSFWGSRRPVGLERIEATVACETTPTVAEAEVVVRDLRTDVRIPILGVSFWPGVLTPPPHLPAEVAPPVEGSAIRGGPDATLYCYSEAGKAVHCSSH